MAKVRVYPGRGCGINNPIRFFETEPEDKSLLVCAIVGKPDGSKVHHPMDLTEYETIHTNMMAQSKKFKLYTCIQHVGILWERESV
jgi:hypothetical protein